MKLNLNSIVYVQLTDLGKEIFYNYWFKIFNNCESTFNAKRLTENVLTNSLVKGYDNELRKDADFYEFHFHDLMKIFGSHIDTSNRKFYFETTEFFTDKEDLLKIN